METKQNKKNDSEKNVEANFVVQDHHLIKSTRVIALDKLIAREIYSVLLLSSDNSPTSQKYFGKVFPNENLIRRKFHTKTFATNWSQICAFSADLVKNILSLKSCNTTCKKCNKNLKKKKIGKSTASKIVWETRKAILKVFKKDCLEMLSFTNDWVETAKDFYDKWNFPNCLGAIDGKYVMIECRRNPDSTYYN